MFNVSFPIPKKRIERKEWNEITSNWAILIFIRIQIYSFACEYIVKTRYGGEETNPEETKGIGKTKLSQIILAESFGGVRRLPYFRPNFITLRVVSRNLCSSLN